MSGKGSIQALWERYWSLPDLPAATTPRYGCYTDYADGVLGEYTILVGHELAPGDALPPHLEVIEIPPATYAVFATRTGPMAEVVSEAWGLYGLGTTGTNARLPGTSSCTMNAVSIP